MRSRAAILDGARRAVMTNGTRITMAQVAARAGVAKATLYNHFRTREDVLAGVLEDEIAQLLDRYAAASLADALSGAASDIAAHPLLRVLAEREPGTLAGLARIDVSGQLWQRALAGLERSLATGSRGGAEMVLRWLASFVLSPASGAEIAADLAILLAGLPDAVPVATPAQVVSAQVMTA
ncbi:MAG TPA: helix-turn-helix domain-containing protein [Jatrophihabitans sp.]